MSAKENLLNAFGTLMTVVIAIVFGVIIPLEIINSGSHRVIAEIGNIRFFGPVFILAGIIGVSFLMLKVSLRLKECKNI